MAIFRDVHEINESLQLAVGELQFIGEQLFSIVNALERIVRQLDPTSTVVGIRIVPGTPFPRGNLMSSSKKKAGGVSVELQKKSQMATKMASPAAGDAGNFILIDNEDDTCTVVGVDSVGNPVDISGVASISVQSDNPAIVTVDAPVGMTFQMHAAGPLGTATINATASWNDGSKGPYGFDLPVETKAGGPAGIMIVPGTPTARTP